MMMMMMLIKKRKKFEKIKIKELLILIKQVYQLFKLLMFKT